MSRVESLKKKAEELYQSRNPNRADWAIIYLQSMFLRWLIKPERRFGGVRAKIKFQRVTKGGKGGLRVK